jgi:hypothetical protein
MLRTNLNHHNMMDPTKPNYDPQVRMIELNAQYRVLSRLQEQFGPNSKHRAALFIDRAMDQVLAEIKLIENQRINN